MTDTADRNLLFGLLALQNGIINQGQLVAAFQAWTLDKSMDLADHLEARGDLDADDRAAVEALATRHIRRHGGDVEKSLAAVSAGKSTRESLAQIGDVDIEATLGRVASAHGPTKEGDPYDTASYSVGSVTSDGQRFRVLRPHARGGLGAVFVALDSELNREVALKQILDHHADDPVSRQRFLIEAEITGGLEHPGIVPVYGLGTYGSGRPYYAMRFIKGDSLKEAVERFHADPALKADPGQRSLKLRKLLRRFTDVCNAIDYAHSRGILHRDIKPGNIIVGKYGETLVVDWGLAKPLGSGKPGNAGEERTLVPSSASGSADTLPGSALGTPAYMSPEQARGDVDRLGPRSDVYSLGATLYCLLAGRPSFEGEDVGEVLRKVQQGQIVPPRSFDDAIDPALEAVCLKAMAIQPEDRYATCRGLADDIERWMADEPVTAWAEPFSQRARRWARRNRTVVTSLAMTVLAALVGTGAVLAVQTQANRALTSKNTELDKANRLKDEANAGLHEANDRVTSANADLKTANDREKQRFDLAMEAIKMFHGEIGDDLVLKAEQFKPLRDKLLKRAADFYGRLEALLKGQPDTASRGAMGGAYFELGVLTANIGDKPAALEAHRKALVVRRELAARLAADFGAQGNVAQSLRAVGAMLEQTGKSAEALARYEEARDLLARLPRSGPDSDRRSALLGSDYGDVARMLAATGKTDAAMLAYQQSVQTLTRLSDENPSVTDFRSRLAFTHNNVGIFQWIRGKPAEAMESYRRALAIVQKLATDNPAAVPFRVELANCHNNIGELLSKTGKPTEAMESYRQALAIRRQLADDNPAVNQFRFDLATSFNSLGWLQSKTANPAEAMESYTPALAIFQKLADDNPAVPAFQRDLAHTHHIIGYLQSETGKHDEAVESYRRTLEIQEKLARDYPSINSQSNLAVTHHNIGNLLLRSDAWGKALESFLYSLAIQQKVVDHDPAAPGPRIQMAMIQSSIGVAQAQTGKPVEALESFRLAAAIQQKLADENPAITEYRFDLAVSHLNNGETLAGIGKRPEARELYRLALAIAQKLSDDNPTVSDYRDLLAVCHYCLAGVDSDLGRTTLAQTGYERAISILDELLKSNPNSADYRRNLAGCLRGRGLTRLSTGDAAGAIADVRRAVALYEGLPYRAGEGLYDLACCHATLASAAGREQSGLSTRDGESEAATAIDLLRRAVAEGYHNVESMTKDTSLDPLRNRPEFRILLTDILFHSKPFARGD